MADEETPVDEERIEDAVAEEEGKRDDAGRRDTSIGWEVQARIFAVLALFVLAMSLGYGLLSQEWAGTTLLALTSVMAFLTAAYIGWMPRGQRRLVATARDGSEPGGEGAAVGDLPEPGHDPHDGVWFPTASIWPFAVAIGMTLVGNGLLLGRWMLLPASVFLGWALVGMIRQGRRRI